MKSTRKYLCEELAARLKHDGIAVRSIGHNDKTWPELVLFVYLAKKSDVKKVPSVFQGCLVEASVTGPFKPL